VDPRQEDVVSAYFSFFGDNAALLLELTLVHILLSVFALVVATVLAIPLGAWIGHLHRFSFLVVSVGNVLRSLPTLAIIAIGIALYGFGVINITVALVILGFPLVLTNTFTAVEGVDPGTVEAARGMGMTGWQILTRVELPSSIPLIMSGIRTSWVYIVATAYLATFSGAQGTLGDIISNIEGYGLAGVLAAATISILLAFLGDALLGLAERALTPTGLRLLAQRTSATAAEPAPAVPAAA
jgi:osmoprotectant transport system permease protein